MNLYRGYNFLSFPFQSNRFRFHWCSLMYVGMYFFSNERPRQSLFTVTCIYTNYKHHKRIVIRFGGRGGERKKETIST